MASKREMILNFCVFADLGTVAEFVGLALRAEVSAKRIAASAASYVLEKRADGSFAITVKKSAAASADDFSTEILKLRCALQNLEVTACDAQGFSKNIPLTELTNWFASQSTVDNAEFAPLNSELNLADLGEIFEALTSSQRPVEKCLDDPRFFALFPYADFVAGSYTSLRHRSGFEIKLHTRNDGTIVSHRLDAPDPVGRIHTLWSSWFSGRGPTKLLATEGSHGVYHIDGYLGSDESRWRISRLLGAVPAEHKPRVFKWAAEVINSVEEYHSTRGGVKLSDIFECTYDNERLIADSDLRFKKG